jgi:hypothetical protein
MKTSKVKMVVNEKSGKVLTEYENDNFGFIILQQESSHFDGQWMRKQKRSCLMRGAYDDLVDVMKEYPRGELPGRLVITEMVEPDFLADPKLVKRFIGKDHDDEEVYEERVSQYVKTAGKDGDELMLGEDRIIRIVDYDFTGERTDTFVEHDNGDSITYSSASSNQRVRRTPIAEPVAKANQANQATQASTLGSADPLANLTPEQRAIVLAAMAQTTAPATEPAPEQAPEPEELTPEEKLAKLEVTMDGDGADLSM